MSLGWEGLVGGIPALVMGPLARLHAPRLSRSHHNLSADFLGRWGGILSAERYAAARCLGSSMILNTECRRK